MAKLPTGLSLIWGSSNPNLQSKAGWYKWVVLLLTYLFYTSYHLSRKPISIVKSVLHCNSTTVNSTCHSWPPFDQDNANELLGTLDDSFLIPYAFGVFISGHIAERMDLRYFLTVGMISSGVTTALFGMGRYWQIHSLPYYIIIQVMTGLLSATGWPAVVACVANWFGKGRRGLIMGIWTSHTSVGNILGSVVAGIFVNYNWGLSFIVPGAIIASSGIICFLFLVPRPEDLGGDKPNHGREEEEDVDHVQHIQAPISSSAAVSVDDDESSLLVPDSTAIQPGGQQETAISFYGALKIPGVVEFSLCLFFCKLVSYTFLYWLPTYITKTSPLNAQQAADLSTAFDFGGIMGGILAGVISDAIGGRAAVCAVMLFLAMPMMVLYRGFGPISGMAVNVVLLLEAGMLVNGPYALITTAVSADLGTHSTLQGNSRALATVTAIIDGTGSLGAALGPLLTGMITNWQTVFYMLIGADFCAMLVSLFIRFRPHITVLCQSIKHRHCTYLAVRALFTLLTLLPLLAVIFYVIPDILRYERGWR